MYALLSFFASFICLIRRNKPTFPFSMLLPICLNMLRQYITSGCNFWRDSRPDLSANVTSVEKLVELIIPKTEYTIHRICTAYVCVFSLNFFSLSYFLFYFLFFVVFYSFFSFSFSLFVSFFFFFFFF
jgi:hypothetical protein